MEKRRRCYGRGRQNFLTVPFKVNEPEKSADLIPSPFGRILTSVVLESKGVMALGSLISNNS